MERALFRAIKSLVRAPVLYLFCSSHKLVLRKRSIHSTIPSIVFHQQSRMSRFVPISILDSLHLKVHPCPALPFSRSSFPLLRTCFSHDPPISLQRDHSYSLYHARPSLLLHIRTHPSFSSLRPPPVLPSLHITHRLWLASILIHHLTTHHWQYQQVSIPSSVILNRAASLLVLLQDLTTAEAITSFLRANGSLTDSDVLNAALLLLEPGHDGLFDEWILQVARVSHRSRVECSMCGARRPTTRSCFSCTLSWIRKMGVTSR